MLRALSGDVHDVHTAVSLWFIAADGTGEVSLAYRTFVDTAHVVFKELSDERIADYLKFGESFDKAGAYAIQGRGADLVDHVDGSIDTVIGLPVQRLLREFPEIAPNAATGE
jgi:septum formation protein